MPVEKIGELARVDLHVVVPELLARLGLGYPARSHGRVGEYHGRDVRVVRLAIDEGC